MAMDTRKKAQYAQLGRGCRLRKRGPNFQIPPRSSVFRVDQTNFASSNSKSNNNNNKPSSAPVHRDYRSTLTAGVIQTRALHHRNGPCQMSEPKG